MKPKVIYCVGAFLLIIGTLFVLNYNKINPISKPVPTSQSISPDDQVTEQKKVEFAIDVLNALSVYYVTTESDIDEDSTYSEIIASLLTSNKYLEEGNLRITGYIDDSNKYINLTATGMDTGAKTVVKANNDIVTFLRNTDLDNPSNLSEVNYQIGLWVSTQKEGYKFISTSAPWVTPLMYEFSESENPSGKIPYTISEEGRQRILKEIERLFGDNLRAYQQDVVGEVESYNAILFSVDAIFNQLNYETYEEANNKNL